MKKIFIYARPCIYKMMSAFFFYWLQSFCPVLSYSLKYGRNQRITAQFFIGIDFFDPDPTKSKNKPQKNCKLHISHISRKTSRSKFWPTDIQWQQKSHQLVINSISVFIVVFKFLQPWEWSIQLLIGNLPNNQGHKKSNRDKYFRNKTTNYNHTLSQN